MAGILRSPFGQKCAEIEDFNAGLLDDTSLLDHPELDRTRRDDINTTNDRFLAKLEFAVKTQNDDMEDASKKAKDQERAADTRKPSWPSWPSWQKLKIGYRLRTRKLRSFNPASSQESERSSFTRML